MTYLCLKSVLYNILKKISNKITPAQLLLPCLVYLQRNKLSGTYHLEHHTQQTYHPAIFCGSPKSKH